MSDFKRNLLALAVAAGLSACAVGPDYQRPANPLPQTFTEPTPKPAEVDALWWKQFKDAQLDQLIDAALANNTDIQRALARMEESDAVLREATATLFPQVDLDASGTRSRVTTNGANPVTTPVRNNFRGAFSASYELDMWGKARRANEAAEAQAQSSRFAKDALSLSLAGNVTQTYLTLRSLDALIVIARDSLNSRRESLDLTSRRHKGGIASDLDVQQASLSVANVQRQLASLQQQRALTEQQLGLLTGQLGLQIAPGDIRSLPLPAIPPAGLPSQLLEARPDVRQAEADLIAANALIGVAKANLFPSISLTGSYGGESRELGDLMQSGSRIWAGGIGLHLPVFDFGRLSARTDQVTAQQKQLLANYQRSVQNAFVDVNNALIKVRHSTDMEAAAQSAVNAADATLKLANIRYQSGYSQFLEVLIAQGTYNDAWLNLIQEKRDRLLATVELYKAIGGGWKS